MNKDNLITFLDSVQRTVIGEIIGEVNGEFTLIKNPVVVNISQHIGQNGQPTGQMALQLLPVFFKEFLGDKSAETIYKYPSNQITRIDFNGGFDFKLYAQYESLFNAPTPLEFSKSKPTEKKVINLFDESEAK